ncbi:DegT/DnrJ/EryC1/StrS family aminotransferase [uncultured Paludibaculum sp.]|uniref:DegT/DnrJ/EryC1/StrS family aminotransferase n=1 Tax=uncultured Paludibaculum sp. TaxID=1765020 RepID=UPI002AAAE770|nr:DegT/DnrJ/EryC1/StrS family aminotransferase [uncultured Paludibaculum sp.]
MSNLALFGGNPVRTKDFPSWPVFDEAEEQALLEVLRGGRWWVFSYGESLEEAQASEGSKVAEFERAFARQQGTRYGVACANGTAALEIALKALGVGAGDEVIVPPYTFVATAAAALAVSAAPIFCDIDYNTLNLDPQRLEQAITPRTRAIIPVHFAGQAADMGAILDIAGRHGIAVLEDAAHAHGAAWNGQGLGTLGRAGTFSFQGSKNMTAGEGGLIITGDRDLAELCGSLVWGGRKLGRPWYEHHRLGWNYRLTEFQAAILLAQLKRLQSQNARRMENGLYLNRQLAQIAGIHPVEVASFATMHSFHLYVFRFNAAEFGIPRDRFLEALQREGIACSAGYMHPLYRNPMFLQHEFHNGGGGRECQIDYAAFRELCPAVERICQEAVWLEHRQLLGDRADMQDIVDAVIKIYEARAEFRPT